VRAVDENRRNKNKDKSNFADVEMTDDEQMKQRQHMLHSEELSRRMRAQHTNSQNRLHMQNTFQAESPDSPWAQHEVCARRLAHVFHER
jgi:hypothetical protein